MTQRTTQCDRILSLLHAHAGQWVTIPMMMELHIADYRRRIFELRQEGWLIETMPQTYEGTVRHSGYRLKVHKEPSKQLSEDTAMFSEYPAETV
jgi:Helix-turn-helix domain